MTEDDWIPISKEQPPADEWLFVVYRCTGNAPVCGRPDGRKIATAHTFDRWKGKPFISYPGAHSDVTHWMIQPPLPKDD